MNYLYSNIKRTLSLIVLLLCFCACEKLVRIDLPNNQMNTPAVFSDINTVKAALSNLYSNVRETPLFRGGHNALGSDFSKYTDELGSFVNEDAFYLNSITVSNILVNQYWDRSYTELYAINAFIEGLLGATQIDEAQKEIFLGEAYFLRALYHHYLCQLYGDIPYVTTTDYKINSRIGKITYLQILEWIEKDLKTALDLLEPNYRHPDRVFPNGGVSELLLAKNYLLQKKYDLAELYAQSVIDNSLYSLETDVNKVYKKSARSTLWQMSPSVVGSVFTSTREAMNYIFTSLPPTNAALSSTLLTSFEPQDLRLQHWTKEVTQGTQSYRHAYKYKYVSNNTDEFSIVFRLEEAYFIKAEALAYEDKVAEAVIPLNEIRTKRGLAALPNTLNKEDFITELLAEYQREFFTEGGHRFLDLKRNNRLSLLEAVKPNWEAKHSLLPIPESELLLNDNLKPQNHGY